MCRPENLKQNWKVEKEKADKYERSAAIRLALSCNHQLDTSSNETESLHITDAESNCNLSSEQNESEEYNVTINDFPHIDLSVCAKSKDFKINEDEENEENQSSAKYITAYISKHNNCFNVDI